MNKVAPPEGYSDVIMITIPIVTGLLGALIAYRLWRFGLSLVGFLGGSALALILLSTKTGGLIESPMGRVAFVIALGIIAGILIHFLEIPVLIGSTSIAGAYATVFGVDIFLKTGFASIFQLLLNNINQTPDIIFTADGKVIAMIVAVIILTLLGCIVQYRANQNRKHR
jgi:hypothetical protein